MLGVSVTENGREGAAASIDTAAGPCLVQVRQVELCRAVHVTFGRKSKSQKGKQFGVEPRCLESEVISLLELV